MCRMPSQGGKTRRWRLLLAFAIVLGATLPVQADTTVPVRARANAEAIANDEQEFERFLKRLPVVTTPGPFPRTFYIMEGDMRFTAGEVRAALLATAADAKAGTPRSNAGELKVMTRDDGQPRIWSKPDRTLEYAVDRASFGSAANYAAVVASMKAATASWMAACPSCGVNFVHRAEYDTKPDINKVFIVKYKPGEKEFTAMAFFPYDELSLRYVWIAPSFFAADPGPRTAVLKHEIGHVLGYRHEHIGGVTGCAEDELKDHWAPVTKYDPRSIMHYFCGGGGMFDMDLTELDKAGHIKTYK